MNKKFAFNAVPTVKKRRSAFDLSHSVKTTMSAGTLYPIYLQEVYPGDTFKDKTNIVARVSSAFLRPVMDNAFMDVYFFFVPNRLVFDKWSQVMGENPNGYWAQSTPVASPAVVYDSADATKDSFVYPGSVADYLGLPITAVLSSPPAATDYSHVVTWQPSILPFRAFALIYDEWFRDQNNIQPMNIIKGDINTTYEKLNNGDWSSTNYCGMLPKVGKVHDYFTSCLPAPQKGGNVDLAAQKIDEQLLPVAGINIKTNGTGWKSSLDLFPTSSTLNNLIDNAGYIHYEAASGVTGVEFGKELLLNYQNAPQSNIYVLHSTSTPATKPGTMIGGTIDGLSANAGEVKFGNLAAYLGEQSINPISVNELRYAIALQRMLEKDALGGTRYTEYLLSHFGVLSPDARLQRSELLGGHRFPLSVQQVAQTSEPSSGNPLGSLGAYSLSNGGARFTKGFVEHGFVIGVACIRQYHTYQQGVEKFWSRHNRIDYYDPVFAHIGEQPVYKKELYSYNVGDAVFGYNEAWADLRYRPNKCTGQMRSDNPATLDIWHFADDYANAPTLNQAFIQETPDYIDRTLAVPSSSQDQFIVDIYHQVRAYRCLPVYSSPSTLGV